MKFEDKIRSNLASLLIGTAMMIVPSVAFAQESGVLICTES